MKYYIFNFITSIYSIILHLILNTLLSYIFSNTIIIYSFFTGLYLLSIGIGVYLTKDKKQPMKMIRLNSIIALFMGFLLLGIMFFHEYLLFLNRGGLDLTYITGILGILFTIVLGIISGVEIPLLYKTDLKRNFQKVLASDYFGAAFGILLFLILYTFFGLIGTLALSQILLVVSIFSLQTNYYLIFPGSLSLYIFINKVNLLEWLDSLSF